VAADGLALRSWRCFTRHMEILTIVQMKSTVVQIICFHSSRPRNYVRINLRTALRQSPQKQLSP
jgi:hypothetical protein